MVAHLSRSGCLVSGTTYMIPRQRKAVNAKTAALRRGFCNKKRGERKNEKEEIVKINVELFDYILSVICEEKKGLIIKFL